MAPIQGQTDAPAAPDRLQSYLATIPEYSTARVQFYYSSLPSRKHSNPTGYAAALAWWRKTLVDLTAKGLLGDDKLVLHADEHLREQLRYEKVGRPSSLGVIIVRPFLSWAVPLVVTRAHVYAVFGAGRARRNVRPRPRAGLPFRPRTAGDVCPLAPRTPVLVDPLDHGRIFNQD